MGRAARTVRRLRVRTRRRLRAAVRRLRTSALPIAQCGVAAGGAWLVAHDLVGHAAPFFAPTAAVISLGVSLGHRLRRAVEMVVGVTLGVLVGDLLVSVIGTGWWQVALAVVLASSAAVFGGGGSMFVNQAASSAVLVATLLAPGQTGQLDRCVDALVGGLVGVLVVVVAPSDPVAPVRRTARTLLDELAAVLTAAAAALRDRDADAAHDALLRARRTQPSIDSLRKALRGGHEITSMSPMQRRRRQVLKEYTELAERADYAVRNARVLLRRTHTALLDDEPVVPDLPEVLTELAAAVRDLTAEFTREGDWVRVRQPVLEVAQHAEAISDDGGALLGPSEQVLVAQVRSIAADLLRATGMGRDEARAAMRTSGSVRIEE